MSTVQTSGSQTAVLTTEHVLATVTAAGTYVLAVDAANLVNGEELQLRIYGKARTGDTERLIYSSTIAHAQVEPLRISPGLPSPHHLKATLKQSGGTGRVFPWAIYAI